jgi:hypothetical protein
MVGQAEAIALCTLSLFYRSSYVHQSSRRFIAVTQICKAKPLATAKGYRYAKR